jgi:hypothetical protein
MRTHVSARSTLLGSGSAQILGGNRTKNNKTGCCEGVLCARRENEAGYSASCLVQVLSQKRHEIRQIVRPLITHDANIFRSDELKHVLRAGADGGFSRCVCESPNLSRGSHGEQRIPETVVLARNVGQRQGFNRFAELDA